MSATGDGVAFYLATAGTVVPPTAAYSYCFWFKPASVTAGLAAKHPYCLTNSGGGTPNGYDANFAWDHPVAGDIRAAIHRNADLSYAIAQMASVPATNTWAHIAVVFNGSTLKVYYNGVQDASVSASALGGGFGNPEVTVCAYNSGATGFFDGAVAQATLWGVAITAAEVLSIAQGTDPSTVQNASILSYCPLNTGTLSSTGPAITNFGTTVNTSYFVGMDGGVTVGGSQTTAQAAYNVAMSGGVALGGSQTTAHTAYGWAMSGGVALGGSATTVQVNYYWTTTGGITIGGANMPVGTTYTISMSGGVTLGGVNMDVSFPVSGGGYILDQGGSAFTTK